MPDIQQVLQQTEQLFIDGKDRESLALANQIVAAGYRVPGLHYLRCQCLIRMFQLGEAIEAARAELAINPSHTAAAGEVQALEKLHAELNKSRAPNRDFSTALSRDVSLAMELASHRYTWRGIKLIKNPLDVALYPLLLWNLKPATIFEIGSFGGGSAVWMGDLTQTFGFDSKIFSVDINPVTAVTHPRVTFIGGDGRALQTVFSAEMLAGLPRPWLVIEDADHTQPTTLAVLDFFHPHLVDGDYAVVEDSMTAVGPRLGLQQFLSKHPGEYLIDGNYCDFFGYNATWCLNGFLRRVIK